MKISNEQLLQEVKKANNITGEYQDNRVLASINDVKRSMAQAGVHAAVLDSDAVVGLIAMGVENLMESGVLSDYVMSRIIQERLTPAPEEGG